MILPDFASTEIWISLLTLIFLEIVLGVDNIIFISISSSKLPMDQRGKATFVGLLLAMVLRIILLFGVSYLIAIQKPWFHVDYTYLSAAVSGQSLLLIGGGLFLLYKSVSEIHGKLEGEEHHNTSKGKSNFTNAIIEIAMINIIFSMDSILTAVGMTMGIKGSLLIMIIAVIVSVGIMILFTNKIGNYINRHPSLQMLGLSFLLLIGFMLILEGAHAAHLNILSQEVDSIPKGYLYFAIAFSLLVEVLNLKLSARKKKVIQLHGPSEEAKDTGIL